MSFKGLSGLYGYAMALHAAGILPDSYQESGGVARIVLGGEYGGYSAVRVAGERWYLVCGSARVAELPAGGSPAEVAVAVAAALPAVVRS